MMKLHNSADHELRFIFRRPIRKLTTIEIDRFFDREIRALEKGILCAVRHFFEKKIIESNYNQSRKFVIT